MAETITHGRAPRWLEWTSLVAGLAVLTLAITELALAPYSVQAAALPAAPVMRTSPSDAWNLSITSSIDPEVRLLAVAPAGPTAVPTVTFTVDPDDRGQTWMGVGGAFTDASVELLSGNQQAVDLLFDPDAEDGARLNLGRLPLSATDFSNSAWTWEWTNGSAQPPREALAAVDAVTSVRDVRPDLEIMATPWTAPAAMRTPDGGLDPDFEGAYADMLASQVAWLQERAVPITSLSLANEPGHSAAYPTLTMSNDQLIGVGARVASALDDVELWAVDHNWSDRDRVDQVLAGADGVFSAAAFHCYDGTPSQMAGLEVAVIVTECTGTDDNWTSTFGWGARVLVAESVRAGSTGLLLWNLALTSEPDVLPDGCERCRGIVTIDPLTGAVEQGPEFYLLAHLARAVDPGAVRVGVTDHGGIPAVAFANPDGTVGVMGHNDTGADQILEFEIADGGSVTIAVGAWQLFSIRG